MAVGKREENMAVEIVKPRNDKRDYRRIVLQNKLEVLLISDPETDKCAASMHVCVGSFSDPEGLEGLAHFLEHMLFYASEKYPEENSYSKYITENGGSTNACTTDEATNYHFEVNADRFEEALDRFAQFFINPTMSADATTREIKAVDSEHQKNLLSDACRMEQLQKHLSAANHPYHKFNTGSWDTLEVSPKKRGIDTREQLLKFYEDNYSANLMHLVVYSKDNLDEAEQLVREKFQDIRNRNCDQIHFTGQPCTTEHLQILVRAVPIKQGHKLKIIWPITPGIRHYKEGPCTYLAHLIHHEGEGSLFYVLKERGWATDLSAGESDWSDEFSFFQVDIDLTDVGQDHFEDIMGLLFKYIHMLQQAGAVESIFKELSAIHETDFHYEDKIQPADYAVNIAANMQLYPPEDWLVASSLPSKFNPSIIQAFLNKLNTDNVRIFWESKKFEGSTSLSEPWYGTAYSMEKVSSATIERWMKHAPNEKLQLPARNEFIPTNLLLKPVSKKTKVPILLRKSAYSRLWYKPDTAFSSPKAYVKIGFSCPYCGHSPEAEVLTEIFTDLLTDYLNEYAYNAEVAGLDYDISNTDSGFQVTLSGYNEKLRELLDAIVDEIAKFEVKEDRFSVIKELVTKQSENFKFQQPYKQAMHYCFLLLNDNTWPWNERLEVLQHLKVNDLVKFYPLLLARSFMECYVAGNIEQAEAESMIQHIEDVFFKGPQPISKPLFASQHLTNRVVNLERGVNYFYAAEGLNPNDENSALIHYIQNHSKVLSCADSSLSMPYLYQILQKYTIFGESDTHLLTLLKSPSNIAKVHQDDFMLNVKLQLLFLIAKEPAFHQLRSVEQLGYITMLKNRSDSGVRGLQFIIQSTAKDPKDIDSIVKLFLKMFESKLYEMTSDEFKNIVNALIDMKREKHKNLWEESQFYWGEISCGTLKFDRRDHEIKALEKLTQEELTDFFNKYIKADAPHKKALSVRVYGSSHTSQFQAHKNEQMEPNAVQIEEIFSFRRSRPLYSSFKGGIDHCKRLGIAAPEASRCS